MTDLLQELSDYSARGLRSRARLARASEARAGCSPRDAMLTVGKMTLYRYRPQSDQPMRPTVFIVYALVNRPDMA
ncbi:MAG: class III poly(R)-hydroxyalkanoic acid synthase subunit PhaC, partial [Gammaproteobacteria bacterium]|nr:class III poly(R)-hydroxyalkanoic acid synthase subunit PhaC [Gammaproteobacteria bacterium]